MGVDLWFLCIEEAHSSLAAILLRLNAGFVSIIERFTKGRSSHADYQALINLSNSSRIEAMRTFEMLSRRISQSSLALESQPGEANGNGRHKRKRRSGSGSGNGKKGGSRSAQSLTVTPLGVASAEGWVRSARKRSSSEGRGMRENTNKRAPARDMGGQSTGKALPSPTSTPVPRDRSPPPQPKSIPLSPTIKLRTTPTANQTQSRTETRNRKSIMSFASDSTKLGEIPEYKWMRPAMFENVAENGDVQFPITTFYPAEPWQEPEKRRGRLRKLFRL